jgi:hypothetical protein
MVIAPGANALYKCAGGRIKTNGIRLKSDQKGQETKENGEKTEGFESGEGESFELQTGGKVKAGSSGTARRAWGSLLPYPTP